ncbi:MAG: HNH endonuclease [Bdellovibrionales bacterium]|nr:HNH endonuclease [Bdellovibrionales bacterium]
MNLKNATDSEILSGLEKLTKSERKITHLILWHILEVEGRKLFLQAGYNSVYKYLTRHLGYSESAAYDRMQAARLLRQVPTVATKTESGTITLTQMVKVQQSLYHEKKVGNTVTKEEARELIEKVESKTTFETEKILACELNQAPKTYQKIKPQQDDSVRLELNLTAQQYEDLKKAQSLLSHIITDNNLAEAIAYLAQNFIQKKEGRPKAAADKESAPAELAKHNSREEKKSDSSTQSFGLMPLKVPVSKEKRKYIAASVRRAVYAKAKNCCEYIHPQNGQRCGSKYQLQVDHIRPLAKGGSEDISNLRILCGVHNRAEALRWGLTKPPH